MGLDERDLKSVEDKVLNQKRRLEEKPPAIFSEFEETESGLLMPVPPVPIPKAFQALLEGPFVPAYVASELGFSHPGRYFLNNEFYPSLRRESGVVAICPFAACDPFFPVEPTGQQINLGEYGKKIALEVFNRMVGIINYDYLMPRTKMLIAIVEGHGVDDGVSAEIAHYANKYPDNPIILVRSDYRLAENRRAFINSAVRHFVDFSSKGNKFVFDVDEAYQKVYEVAKEAAERIKKQLSLSSKKS